ncbi:hypothetical protein XH93_33030 [Bradyrhizobium sp. CCBAU 51753]|nr:hypothetical protein XH93_33030 [Bradyrhizobium sp. CCBAU 51753]
MIFSENRLPLFRIMLVSGDRPMSAPDQDKQRNREIAANEAEREAVSAVRVSSWAIGIAVILGVIAVAIVWAWMSR